MMRIRSRKKKVFIVGRTGNGKTGVANAILGRNDFEEGASPTSITKTVQIGENDEFITLDTIGFGDTELEEGEVLRRVAEAIHEIQDGVNCVLFVAGTRLSREERNGFLILSQVVFNREFKNFMRVVVTKNNEFENPDRVGELKAQFKAAWKKYCKVELSEDQFIFVDNNPEDPRKRRLSGDIIKTAVRTMNGLYKPPRAEEVDRAVGEYIKKKKAEEKKAQLLEEALKKSENEMKKIRSENKVLSDEHKKTLSLLENNIKEFQRSKVENEKNIAMLNREMSARVNAASRNGNGGNGGGGGIFCMIGGIVDHCLGKCVVM